MNKKYNNDSCKGIGGLGGSPMETDSKSEWPSCGVWGVSPAEERGI